MKKIPSKSVTGLLASLAVAVVVGLPAFVLAFTTIGGSLGLGTSGFGYQRDIRIQNNSPDVASNNNTTPEASYPGATGASLAVWKAAKGWASENVLAARNFDYDWQGTSATNNSNANTVGWATGGTCSGGVLAYTETPIDDGWRCVMCDSWNWDDGPGAPGGGAMDIQGVVTHEIGHALGLGHSTFNCGNSAQATMCAAIYNFGFEERTITTDDQAGLQAVYSTIPANKPVITSLGGSFANGGTLIINGSNFANTVNVKFTAGTGVNTGAIPGVVSNVASSAGGTQISVVIPAAALDGNVIVWEPSLARMSNAFPIDINFVPPAVPTITSFSPNNVQAFAGGTVTMNGSGFTTATQVTVGATALTGAGFTVVNNNQITFLAPTATALGPVSVTVTSPSGTSAPNSFNYVQTFPAKLTTSSQVTFSNQNFTWFWGGGSNDFVYLIAATDPTTADNGTPYQWLVNYLTVTATTSNATGLGQHTIAIPPGLTGVTFYSQVASVDNISPTFSGSNIPATLILF